MPDVQTAPDGDTLDIPASILATVSPIPRPYLLICEGPCNKGQVQKFDKVTHETGRSQCGERGDGEDRMPVSISNIDPSWLEAARSFVHTPHAHRFQNQYQCTVCLTVRAYGGRDFQ